MVDEMGIETGIDVDRLLELGRLMERTIGRRLRSEAIMNGRIPKEPRVEFKRKGLAELKRSWGKHLDRNFRRIGLKNRRTKERDRQVLNPKLSPARSVP